MLFSSSEQPGFSSQTGRRQSLVRISRLAAFTLVLLLIVNSGLPTQAAVNSNLAATSTATPDPNSQNKQFHYFEATGHSLSGPLLRYYTRTGGEDRHGKPISEPVRYKDHYQQYFERSILEFYPEYVGSGQEVRLAPLGQWVASEANMSFSPVTPFVGNAEKWYFPETGHSLSEPFLSYWRNTGEEITLG